MAEAGSRGSGGNSPVRIAVGCKLLERGVKRVHSLALRDVLQSLKCH